MIKECTQNKADYFLNTLKLHYNIIYKMSEPQKKLSNFEQFHEWLLIAFCFLVCYAFFFKIVFF